MERLDLLGVQAFIAVAEAGSFVAASRYLHISQTALTRRLQKLEAALGVALIERTTRSVSVTKAGIDFLPRALRNVRDLSAALQELRDTATKRIDLVVIGCLPTVAATKLAGVIRAYRDKYPQSRLRVVDLSATELRHAVLSSELDFAVSILGTPHNELVSEALFTEPMIAACPAGHHLTRRGAVTWKDLEGETLIGINSLSDSRMLTEQIIQTRRLDLHFAFEVTHITTAVGLVAGGAGIAVLPASAVGQDGGGRVEAVTLRSPHVERSIDMFRRRDRPLSPSAEALRKLVIRTLRPGAAAEKKRSRQSGA